MSSLQEQLLKAGLADKKKSRQATLDKKKQHKQKRHNAKHKIETEDSLKKEIAQAQAEKLAQDKQRAEELRLQQEEKELQQRIKQLLEHHCIKDYDGEVKYNFTYDKRVKNFYVTEQIQRSLVNGSIAICVFSDQFFLVPESIAHRIAELDPAVIATLNQKSSEPATDEDDPYADFAIPDDLMW